MNSVWICAVGLCGATIIGSILGFLIKEIPHKWNDTILGYCAGVMLAASTIGLILLSLVIGLLEVVGVWLGYGLGSSFESILPMTLAIAGGAMLYVTSDEMIPETHAHGYQKQATYALLLGFMTLLLIEHLFE